MRITELIARHVRIPLLRRVRHAAFARDESDSFVVCCRLDDGTEGWGEGVPRQYVTGDTIETTFEHLQQSDLPKQLGENFVDVAAATRACDELTMSPAGPDDRLIFGNAARCAIELSVLDAVTRATGAPLSSVTAISPATVAIRKSQPRVRYSGVMTSTGAFRDWTWVRKLRSLNFSQCKLKVGLPDQDDAATLAKLRKSLGEEIDLRIDVNGAWTCANLKQKLAPLLPHRISAVEQPVPHAEVAGLTAIRKDVGVPIILDESLCGFRDGARAMTSGTCDLFNIKLSKCGGFLTSLKLAGLAYAAGLGYQLGCHAGESGILSAAGRHFAGSLADVRFAEGSYDRYLVKETLIKEDITFEEGGFAPTLTKPGLGVEIDLAAIQRLTRREEHVKFPS